MYYEEDNYCGMKWVIVKVICIVGMKSFGFLIVFFVCFVYCVNVDFICGDNWLCICWVIVWIEEFLFFIFDN